MNSIILRVYSQELTLGARSIFLKSVIPTNQTIYSFLLFQSLKGIWDLAIGISKQGNLKNFNSLNKSENVFPLAK